MADDVNPNDLEIADELIAERRKEKPGETPHDMTCLLYTSPSPRD